MDEKEYAEKSGAKPFRTGIQNYLNSLPCASLRMDSLSRHSNYKIAKSFFNS